MLILSFKIVADILLSLLCDIISCWKQDVKYHVLGTKTLVPVRFNFSELVCV